MIEEETRPMIKGRKVDLFLYKFSHSPRPTATVHAYQGSEPNERLACSLFWSGPLKALAKIQSVVSATAAHRRQVHGLVPRRRMQCRLARLLNSPSTLHNFAVSSLYLCMTRPCQNLYYRNTAREYMPVILEFILFFYFKF